MAHYHHISCRRSGSSLNNLLVISTFLANGKLTISLKLITELIVSIIPVEEIFEIFGDNYFGVMGVNIISVILSRVNREVGQKREIPEKNHLITHKQNLACLTCDLS